MSQEKTTLEIIAPSIEEAVAKGLSQLGLKEEDVDVEILDSGNRGFLGLGTRQARIRLSLKGSDVPAASSEKASAAPQSEPATPVEEIQADEEPQSSSPTEPVSPEDERVLKIAEQVTSELLAKMSVRARVKTEMVPPADENDQALVMVEIQGDDLSILIGRRSETLNALQYITSLIVAKEVGQWVPLMIDVQGYRARRERQLRVLARRSAEQVVQSGKKMSLEPMPANERRIIHLELRDHPQVTTESIGEEPNRKVTIFLKKD